MTAEPRRHKHRHQRSYLRIHLTEITYQQSEARQQESEWQNENETAIEGTRDKQYTQSHKLHCLESVAERNSAADIPSQNISQKMKGR